MMNDTASRGTRERAIFLIIGGVIACVTPVWPIGLCMIGVGLFIIPATYLVEPVEVKALESARESGGGCGWVILAGLMIVVIGIVGIAMISALLGG